MISSPPRVSIGMPVFNGEKYLKQAIDSILEQTYQDFELIISDNASTDKTQQICLEYAKKDNRINYHRNTRNIGAPKNYNHVFWLSSGEYFKWTAHDDILITDYLEKCVRVLDNDPSVVLCHSLVNKIDENGTIVGNYDDRTLFNISSSNPHERFRDLITERNTCWAFHGVVRTNSLKKTPLHGDYIYADRNLLAELGLVGKIYEIPEHLVLRRDHSEAYTRTFYSKGAGVRNYRSQSIWWTGRKRKRILVLPHWRNCLEFFRSVNRVPLKWSERWLCYNEIIRWILREGWPYMKWDLINEVEIWAINLRNKQRK